MLGRITARRRLRKAIRESLAIPAFSSPIDCTPWVLGGLWPAELSSITAETAPLADCLEHDLQRIAGSANGELTIIKRAGMPDSARRLAEARVVDEARLRAVQRVESTMRQVRASGEVDRRSGEPAIETQVLPVVRDGEPDDGPAGVVDESESQRIQRLLAFVVRQEPRLCWAVGNRLDGATILVTDLAHGWIPPGITLPAGVRLLGPARRAGKVSGLLGETRARVSYLPGQSIGRPSDFAATETSVQPRELPAVDDLGWQLARATLDRDGLPQMVHTLAGLAAAGTGVVADELDLLRVHLETAQHQLLSQYPHVEPALLLNCLLLAATVSCVARDRISANYHLAWFRTLDEPAASQRTTMYTG